MRPVLLNSAVFPISSFTANPSVSLDIGSGPGRVVLAYIGMDTGTGSYDPTACTVGGVSMNAEAIFGNVSNANRKQRLFWQNTGLPSGTQTVQGTVSGSAHKPQMIVLVFQDTDSTVLGVSGASSASTTAVGGAFLITGVVTTPDTNALAVSMVFDDTALSANAEAGSTQVANDVSASVGARAYTKPGVAGTTSVGWNYTLGASASRASISLNGAAPVDSTAPTLTSPTGTKTGSTTASGTVSTDEANGTLYRLASINATETAATVKAAALTTAVTATGSQSVTFTGLTPNTTYYAHYVHRDAATNDSARVSSASFTTDPAADATAPTLTGTIGVSALTSTSYTATCPVATDNVAVTGYQYRINAGAWTTIAAGGRAINITGRTASTTDTLEMRAFDAATNYSSALSASVNLPAVATYAVSAGPCYFNTGSGPQLSVAVTWSLIYANVGGYSGATTVDGTGTLHATTGLLSISGLAASGAADLYIKDAAGGIYYQRVTAA